MSSPIAKIARSRFDALLVAVHGKLAHGRRIKVLAEHLAPVIRGLPARDPGAMRALDVGCGDMSLADTLAAANPALRWTCCDIHALPGHLATDPRWSRYVQFDGERLPFPDREFDVVLLVDVLHHCREQAVSLLREAARVGAFVVVKDHFEYGWFSRTTLRILDFVGNYGYGVSVPMNYFTPATFREALAAAGVVLRGEFGFVDVYGSVPGLRMILSRRWHFMGIAANPPSQ